jgi:hypothetical protein
MDSQGFLRIYSEITITVGNSTLLQIYTLPKHTLTIGMCIIETQRSSLLYNCGASIRPKGPMLWMSVVI